MRTSYCFPLVLCFLMGLTPMRAFGQSHIHVSKVLNYKQPVTPQGADNYLYSTFYFQGKNAYNMRGFNIGASPYDVISMKYNPIGTTFALLSSKSTKSQVSIFDAWEENKIIHEFQDVLQPVAMSYSVDSRFFYIADTSHSIYVYDTKTYNRIATWGIPAIPHIMITSPNGYFLALVSDEQVFIVNVDTGALRTTISLRAKVNDITFSNDSQQLGIVSADGVLTIVETNTFSKTGVFVGLGSAHSLAFHPDGKYVSVLTSDTNICFQNIMDAADRPTITDVDGGLSFLRYLKDGKQNTFLTYNTKGALKYQMLNGFTPNYTRLLTEELNARMNEWAKMRPDESLEDYQARVNEESRLQKAQLFEQEIATRMAGDLVSRASVQLGNYNRETSMLKLSFDNMPQIFLTVPEEEIASFTNPDDLEFRDVIYGLTRDDKFEITYANVFNRSTGKTYEFNNLQRESLDFLLADDDFVPIELVQQTSMEEVKLGKIKDEIVNTAMKNNLISDHTRINVGTEIVSDVDADGKKISNYKIRFDYTVEGQYSMAEDFAPGKYILEQSHAAISMLDIVQQAFLQDFSKYLVSGKKLQVTVTGSADALKISGVIPYDSHYGDFENEPYRLNNDLKAMTVTRQTGIRSNEQLAFLRAAGVKNYIQQHIPVLGEMNTTYLYKIELAEGTGGEFRRINVEFLFVNAF